MFYLDSTPQQQQDYIERLNGLLSVLFVDWTHEQVNIALELIQGLRNTISLVPQLRSANDKYEIYKHLLIAKNLTENFPPNIPVEADEAPFGNIQSEVVNEHSEIKVVDANDKPRHQSSSKVVVASKKQTMAELLPALPVPLRNQAEHIQDLYFAPLGRAHQEAMKLVEEAIDKAALHGFINGKFDGMPANDKGMKNPLYPDMVRQKYAQQICEHDDRLQHLWKLIHFYNDYDQSNLSADEMEIKVKLLSKARQLSIPVESHETKSSYKKSPTMAEILEMPDDEERKEIMAFRIERNKKLLRRQDRKPSESYKQTLMEAASELHSQNILITRTQHSVLTYYGIEIDESWLEPTKEQKAESLKAKHESKQWKEHVASKKKESYDKNHPEAVLRRQMKAEINEEKKELFND